MAIDISKLREDHFFENDKIKIRFYGGTYYRRLSVHMKDEEGAEHHALEENLPDKADQNFDKTNQKVKDFIQNKIDEWVHDQERKDIMHDIFIRERELKEEKELTRLLYSF